MDSLAQDAEKERVICHYHPYMAAEREAPTTEAGGCVLHSEVDAGRETTSETETGEGILVELRNVIKVSQESRAGATQALASAGALDSKADSAFDDESVHLADNIDALTRAIAALKKGVAMSSVLQSRIGCTTRKMQSQLTLTFTQKWSARPKRRPS